MLEGILVLAIVVAGIVAFRKLFVKDDQPGRDGQPDRGLGGQHSPPSSDGGTEVDVPVDNPDDRTGRFN